MLLYSNIEYVDDASHIDTYFNLYITSRIVSRLSLISLYDHIIILLYQYTSYMIY